MRQDIMLRNLGFLDINPLTLGFQYCEPGHKWGPSLRNYFLLHYVFSGRGAYSTPRGEYEIEQGQVFVIRPDVICSYQADWGDPWHYCWVGFNSGRPLESILAEDVYDAIGCGPLFRSLPDAESLVRRREWFVCGLIYEILSLLGVEDGGRPIEASRYVRMARNYIESQYMEEIKIADIALHLGLNRSYFSRIFQRDMGKSPQDYLVDFRLQKAAELLLRQDIPVGEAARMVGYADELNFSRMFRRRYGMAPGRYRTENRK